MCPLINAQQIMGPLQAGETQVTCSAGEHDASDWKTHPDVEAPKEHVVMTTSPKEHVHRVKTQTPAAENLVKLFSLNSQ